MPVPNFIQIHTLTSYGPSLLNRDNDGMAKRIIFGGTVRTRVSSSCIKYHLRTATGRYSLANIPGVKESIRSRETITQLVIQPLRELDKYDPEVLDALQDAFNMKIYSEKGLKKEDRQPLVLGAPEVAYFTQKANEILQLKLTEREEIIKAVNALFSNKGEGSNFTAMMNAIRLPAGLIAALFGRMITSDFASNIEAPIHVSHPFTVHRQESVIDYFSVVEDLATPEDRGGAAHLGQSELTSGLYYGYVVIDVPALVSNLEGCPSESWLQADRTMAVAVVDCLLHTLTQVTPGAKLGSTAAHSYSDLLLVEATDRAPRGLYNAYRKPVSSSQTDDAVKAMAEYIALMDARYGKEEERRVLLGQNTEIPGAPELSMMDLGNWAADIILKAEAE